MNVCLLCILFNTDDRFVFDDEDVKSPTNAPSLPAAGRPTSAPGRVTQEALKKVLHRMNKILAKLPRDMEAIRNSQQKLEGKVKALENSCAECKKTLHGTKAAEDLPKTSQKEPGNPNPTPNPNPNPNPSPGKNKGLQKISDRIVMVEKSQRAMLSTRKSGHAVQTVLVRNPLLVPLTLTLTLSLPLPLRDLPCIDRDLIL